MKYLKKISLASALIVLIAAFTFTVSQAQNNNKNNRQNNQANNGNGYAEMVMGKVVNVKTGKPVARATVIVMASGTNMNHEHTRNYGMRNEDTLTTNAKGMFKAKNIAPGRHTIKVSKDNYQFWQNTINLSPENNNGNYAGYNYYPYGYGAPNGYNGYYNNGQRQPPFHGFFRPDSTKNGFFHGVFHKNNNDTTKHHQNRHNKHKNQMNRNNNRKNANYGTNSYSKNLFLTIRLQKK
jgi:hypothetical protein